MHRNEYLLLRAAQKVIKDDVRFRLSGRSGPLLMLESVPIEVAGSTARLTLQGHYHPTTRSVTYNISAAPVGAICRVDVRGAKHKDQGRTHKHELQTDRCPRNNLPVAVARPDLETLDAEDVFKVLCEQANIKHEGKFVAPDLRE